MLLVDGYQALLQPWDIRARREVPECVVLMCPTTFHGWVACGCTIVE